MKQNNIWKLGDNTAGRSPVRGVFVKIKSCQIILIFSQAGWEALLKGEEHKVSYILDMSKAFRTCLTWQFHNKLGKCDHDGVILSWMEASRLYWENAQQSI